MQLPVTTLYQQAFRSHTEHMELSRERERYSWADYLQWPEDERYELVEGVPYAMSPAPGRRHQEIGGELFHQMYSALRGTSCRVFHAPFDVKLSAQEADDAPTVLQPDITVTCDPAKLTKQGVSGAPDLVVEIVSPDSGLADRRRKFDLYQTYGVGEYWIVDQDESLVEVYRLDTEGRYLRAGVYGKEDRLSASAVPELEIELGTVFSAAD